LVIWSDDQRMLNRLQNIAVIALAALFVIGFGVETWRASNTPHVPIYQSATKQKERTTNAESPKESAEEAIVRYNKWLTIFTAILAIATVGLGFATIGLYSVSQGQLKHAELESRRTRVHRLQDEMRIEEQIKISRQSSDAAKLAAQAAIGVEIARVLISNIEFQWASVANLVGNLQFPKVAISVKNYGRTPAFVSNQASEMLIAPVLPETPEYPNAHDLMGCVIEGKDNYYLPVARLRRAIPQETINDIVIGKTFIWVYGHLFYRDFLHNPHWLKFCAQLDVIDRGGVRVIEGGPAKYTDSY
jgi:hypothetical protein